MAPESYEVEVTKSGGQYEFRSNIGNWRALTVYGYPRNLDYSKYAQGELECGVTR